MRLLQPPLRWLLQAVLSKMIPQQSGDHSAWSCLRRICDWITTLCPHTTPHLLPEHPKICCTESPPEIHSGSCYTALTLLQMLGTEKHVQTVIMCQSWGLIQDPEDNCTQGQNITVCPRWKQLHWSSTMRNQLHNLLFACSRGLPVRQLPFSQVQCC